MSEFYFDYKCIAMNASSAGTRGDSDKALDFYLYQDYGSDHGEMCVQIYVPKALQKKYCGARLYFNPNSVDFPDIGNSSSFKQYVISPYSIKNTSGDTVPDIAVGNNVMINEGLSGCGILAFIDGQDPTAPPKPENAYKFVINYTKKESISYCIEEKKNGLTVRIIYPLIRTPINLGVLYKKDAKPVLIADRSDASKYLKDKSGEPVIITLKPTGRKSSTITVNLGARDTDKNDFRLVFEDITNNRNYLLVDESEYTIEDMDDRKRAMALKRGANGEGKGTPPKRCPYCGRWIWPLAKEYEKRDTVIADCQGNVIALSSDDPKLRGKHTIVCISDIIARSDGKIKDAPNIYQTENVDYAVGEKLRLILPPSSLELPSMNVVVAGYPGSGKTMYLASVMNVERNGNKAETNPIILHKILNKFVAQKSGKTAEQRAQELKFDCVRITGRGNGTPQTVYDYKYEEKRSSVYDADGKIKMRYVLTVGNAVESFTSPMDATRLAYNPIGYQMGELGNMYFYDIPGELFVNPQPTRAVDVADCFIAVIDGDPKVSNEDPIKNLRTSLENIKKLATVPVPLETMPIAIVFTKHDKKLSDYVSKTNAAAREACFDENCHVVREDILGLIKDTSRFRYEGSALERHIDCSSYELEHYLKARNRDDFKEIISNYKNIKFFTCSALGNDVCLMEKDGRNKEVLFKPRRMRVELPLIWLMYQKGLIKR